MHPQAPLRRIIEPHCGSVFCSAINGGGGSRDSSGSSIEPAPKASIPAGRVGPPFTCDVIRWSL